jgi:hypothetical protein
MTDDEQRTRRRYEEQKHNAVQGLALLAVACPERASASARREQRWQRQAGRQLLVGDSGREPIFHMQSGANVLADW